MTLVWDATRDSHKKKEKMSLFLVIASALS